MKMSNDDDDDDDDDDDVSYRLKTPQYTTLMFDAIGVISQK